MELEEALRHARGIAGECHVNSRLWDRAEMAVPHYLWTLGTRKDRRAGARLQTVDATEAGAHDAGLCRV